jgi:phenylacetate-coenzyme A ligase PaaK-like adenylate-forming protein
MSICKKIDEFRPECIIGFPGPLRHLALLNEKGYGKNINPKCIISTGGLLDNFEKKYIKEVFHTKVFDIYASNEAGPISFECKEGNYHIHSDIQYLEVIDSKGNLKDIGKKGILAITRTYGHGTPIIRYTGMDDIVQLKEGECSCGLNTELMEPVHGRIKESIVLPDGRIIYPRKLMDLVGDAVKDLKTNKIQFLQIVQKSLDKIEVLVVIDEDKRHKDESVELFLGEVGKSYQQYFGPEVRFEIKEVKKLRTEENRPDSMPGIISKIDVKKHIV